MSELTLRQCANFVRSKNAGPFAITIDIFFADPQVLDRAWNCDRLQPQNVAAIYGIAAGDVRRFRIDQAMAIKLSMPRPIVAGDIGDTDVAGGQQFYPLLDLPIV